jgi:hypothetical protein
VLPSQANQCVGNADSKWHSASGHFIELCTVGGLELPVHWRCLEFN